MFSNFDKAFKKNPIKNTIPKEILKLLNKGLPDNFEYVNIGNGACALSLDRNDKITLDISDLEIPQNDKKYIKTSNDLAKYLYRTQQKIKVKLYDNKYIKLNNMKLDIKELVKFPLDERTLTSNAKFYLVPKKFLPPFPLLLESNGIKKRFMVQQCPYNSMTKLLFKSESTGDISISYILDEIDNSLNLTLNINSQNIKNIKSLIEAFKFYNGFCDGNICISGNKISKITNEAPNKIPLPEITFWEKVYAIQEKLKLSFNPSIDMTNDDIYSFEKLYRSFIENEPFKEYEEIESLKLKINKPIENNDIIGQKISLNFSQNYSWNLLGENFNFTAISVIFNVEIVNCQNIGDEMIEVVFSSVKDKKSYKSTQFFEKNNDILKSEKISKEFIEKFQNAKEINI